MEIISAQEYQSAFSEIMCLKEKFVELEQENHRLLSGIVLKQTERISTSEGKYC